MALSPPSANVTPPPCTGPASCWFRLHLRPPPIPFAEPRPRGLSPPLQIGPAPEPWGSTLGSRSPAPRGQSPPHDAKLDSYWFWLLPLITSRPIRPDPCLQAHNTSCADPAHGDPPQASLHTWRTYNSAPSSQSPAPTAPILLRLAEPRLRWVVRASATQTPPGLYWS